MMHRIWIINWDDTLFASTYIGHLHGLDWTKYDTTFVELKIMNIFKQILKYNNSYISIMSSILCKKVLEKKCIN